MPEQLEIYEELKIINNQIKDSYKKLLEYKLNNNNILYNKELNNLKELLEEEKNALQLLDIDEIIDILEEFEVGMLRNLHSMFDKFYTIPLLNNTFEEEFDFRMMNNIRDISIFNDRISKFNDEDIYDTDKEYDAKMLNTLVVEYQLFNDLLSLFICAINEYIERIDNKEIKNSLITYKYILLFVYGKNNLSLLDDNVCFDNTYCYSKLVYDTLIDSNMEVAYNYEIIKSDYLDKALHVFFSEVFSVANINSDNINRILQSCYSKAILTLYGNDHQLAKRIFIDSKKSSIYFKHINRIFEKSENSARNSKVLTLRK